MKQKEFNWEEFISSNNIAVHCATEEQAIGFCRKMHEHGLKWCTVESYLKLTEWKFYEEETAYTSDGYFTNLVYCKNNNYTVLKWSDYTSNE